MNHFVIFLTLLAAARGLKTKSNHYNKTLPLCSFDFVQLLLVAAFVRSCSCLLVFLLVLFAVYLYSSFQLLLVSCFFSFWCCWFCLLVALLLVLLFPVLLLVLFLWSSVTGFFLFYFLFTVSVPSLDFGQKLSAT